MERGQCLMSMKRQIARPEYFQAPVFHSLARSRDVRSFSEDCGGCIWPPRSYSCSFCTREFISAQALGGHMNVHRRDRARLKQQSLNAQTLIECEKKSEAEKPPVLDRNLDENNVKELSFVASFIKKDDLQELPRKPDEAKKKNLEGVIEGSMCMAHDDGDEYHVRTDLSVGLISCKRAKTNNNISSRLPFLNISNDKCSFKFEALDLFSSKKINHEDLDLELRLGADPPKVK